MEKEGYRLVAIHDFYRFEFAKSKCKDTKYFFIYNFMREYRSYPSERKLKSDYQADIVNGEFFTGGGITKVYRISNPYYDLTELSTNRDSYLQHVFSKRILIYLMFFILLLVGAKAISVGGHSFGYLVMLIISIVLALFVLWNIYEFIVLTIRSRKGVIERR